MNVDSIFMRFYFVCTHCEHVSAGISINVCLTRYAVTVLKEHNTRERETGNRDCTEFFHLELFVPLYSRKSSVSYVP